MVTKHLSSSRIRPSTNTVLTLRRTRVDQVRDQALGKAGSSWHVEVEKHDVGLFPGSSEPMALSRRRQRALPIVAILRHSPAGNVGSPAYFLEEAGKRISSIIEVVAAGRAAGS